MRIAIIALLLAFSAPFARAGIMQDVVAVPREEIEKHALPVTAEITRSEAGKLALKVSLKEPSGGVGRFLGIELRVLKKPVSIAEIKTEFYRSEMLARSSMTRERTCFFEIKEDEIPNSYIVVGLDLGIEGGRGKMRSLCISVPPLLGQTK